MQAQLQQTFREDLNEKQLSFLIFLLTSERYTFAITSDRMFGDKDSPVEHCGEEPFYQLMPHDGETPFFNWYCEQEEYKQFFKTKTDCTLNFLLNYEKWKTVKDQTPDDKTKVFKAFDKLEQIGNRMENLLKQRDSSKISMDQFREQAEELWQKEGEAVVTIYKFRKK